jgi:hypothetical protein
MAAVAYDDMARPANHGTLHDFVIVRVSANHLEGIGSAHKPRKLPHFIRSGVSALGCVRKFALQLLWERIKDFLACR